MRARRYAFISCFVACIGCSSSDDANPGGAPSDATTSETTLDDSSVDSGADDTGFALDTSTADSGGADETAIDSAPADSAMEDVPPFDATVDCSQPLVYPQSPKGSPPWKIGQAVLFKGNMPDNDAFLALVSDVVGPKHVRNAAMGVFRGAFAHDPPYETELGEMLAKTAYKNTGCLALSDLTAPSGFALLIMMTASPAATMGKSFEQPDGGPLAAIGNLQINGDLYANGVLVDDAFDSTFPKAVAAYDYPATVTVEGWSHFLLLFGDNQAVSPTPLPAGNYVFELRISSDASTYKSIDRIGFTVK
jgi:hypothetical protein